MRKIIYPSAIAYDFMFQRPGQLMKALGELNYETLFYNRHQPIAGSRLYKRKTKKGKNHYIIPEKTDMSKFSPFIYLYSYPPNIDDVNGDAELMIFDSVDSPSGPFQFWNANDSYKRSLKEADIVLATAKSLYETAKEKNDNVVLVPNACDFEHFHNNKEPTPKIFNKLKGPVVTYMGAVASWLDRQLIRESAMEYPDYNFLIIGANFDSDIGNMPDNVHILGHLDYNALPPYVNNSDVLTIPFKAKDRVIQCANPIKMYEYFATGNPVVTTAMPETKIPGVYWGRDKYEYIGYIEKAVNEKENKKDRRVKFARKNTWAHRAQTISDAINEAL